MKILLITLLAVLAVYLGLGFYLAPRYFEQSLKRQSAEYLAHDLQIGHVRLNPLNFTAQLEHIVLLNAAGKPLFTAAGATADTSFWGFWGRTGQLLSLAFEEPALYVDDHEAGRMELMRLLSDLFAVAGKLPEQARIASLSFTQGTIVVVDGSHTPDRRTPSATFDLVTASFDSSRQGSFHLSLNNATEPGFDMEGEVTWAVASATGHFGLTGLDLQLLGTWFGVPPDSARRRLPASVKSRFKAAFSEDGLVFELDEAHLTSEPFELNLEHLVSLAADLLSVDFSMSLLASHEGLEVREAAAKSGGFMVRGLRTDSSAAIQIPVGRAELSLSNFVSKPDQPGEFDLQMYTEPSGVVQLSRLYRPDSRNGATLIHLVKVPMSSLIAQSQGLLPRALYDEVLSAHGSLQWGSIQWQRSATNLDRVPGLDDPRLPGRLNRAIDEYGAEPVATMVLSGRLESGGELELVGLTHPTDPLRNSYVEVDLTRMEATMASPYTIAFDGQKIASGSLDINLAVRIAGGQLTGHQDLAGLDLVLEKPAGTLEAPERSLDFALALLRDEDNVARLTVPIAAVVDSNLAFPELLNNSVSAHLTRLVAEPFTALANMLGTNPSRLATISFVPGQAGLDHEAMDQLQWLKTALQWRPALSLQVAGGYDPEADRYALAYQQVRLHVLLATAADPEFRANTSPIEFSDPKVQIVLDEFSGSRLDAVAVTAIAEKFGMAEESTESPPSAAQRAPYYRALFDALVAHEVIGERALLSLARYRARAVIEQLAGNGIEKQRLGSDAPEPLNASVFRGVPVRLTLGVFTGSTEPAENRVDEEGAPINPAVDAAGSHLQQ